MSLFALHQISKFALYYVLAMGHIIGIEKVCAASLMNKHVAIFASEKKLVYEIIATRLSIDKGHFVFVFLFQYASC